MFETKSKNSEYPKIGFDDQLESRHLGLEDRGVVGKGAASGVKDAGGLAIVGTERHESRRVDRQLRGRAGRQGDPGSSQFFVSLEDNLMRLFGSERISNLMVKMGIEEGEVIQHSMISSSIERAQKKVEENFTLKERIAS